LLDEGGPRRVHGSRSACRVCVAQRLIQRRAISQGGEVGAVRDRIAAG